MNAGLWKHIICTWFFFRFFQAVATTKPANYKFSVFCRCRVATAKKKSEKKSWTHVFIKYIDLKKRNRPAPAFTKKLQPFYWNYQDHETLFTILMGGTLCKVEKVLNIKKDYRKFFPFPSLKREMHSAHCIWVISSKIKQFSDIEFF